MKPKTKLVLYFVSLITVAICCIAANIYVTGQVMEEQDQQQKPPAFDTDTHYNEPQIDPKQYDAMISEGRELLNELYNLRRVLLDTIRAEGMPEPYMDVEEE